MGSNLILDKLQGVKDRFEEVARLITEPETISDMKRYVKLNKEYKDLEPVIQAFDEYKNLFKDFNFISIGIFAPLAVIEQRERERKDRTWGLARWQYDIVHKDKIYDLKIDSSKSTAEECAKQIKYFISKKQI